MLFFTFVFFNFHLNKISSNFIENRRKIYFKNMRRLIRLCTAGIKSIPRWIPPAIALAGVGLGTAICASPPPESMPNSYQPLVNLDPIKHDGNQLQVPLKTRETHLKEIENT